MKIDNGENSDAFYENDDLVSLIPQIRAFAMYLCRNATEAEDLTQAALENAWRGQAGYTPGTNMKAWVLRIVRNQYYSGRRQSWRMSQFDPDVEGAGLVVICNPVAALELDDVRRAMDELSDDQRQALNLVAIVGMPYHQAAEICDCAVGTVKSRVSRARRALGAVLDQGQMTSESRPPSLAMASILAEAERDGRSAQARARPASAQNLSSLAA